MRIVASIAPDVVARRGRPGPDVPWAQTLKRTGLADLVPGQPVIDLARAYDGLLAEACARHPTRTLASPTSPCSPPKRRRRSWSARPGTSASTACW